MKIKKTKKENKIQQIVNNKNKNHKERKKQKNRNIYNLKLETQFLLNIVMKMGGDWDLMKMVSQKNNSNFINLIMKLVDFFHPIM